jgi:hypothetical protein
VRGKSSVLVTLYGVPPTALLTMLGITPQEELIDYPLSCFFMQELRAKSLKDGIAL